MKRLSRVSSHLNVYYWIVLMAIMTSISLIVIKFYSVLLENWFVTLTTIATIFGSLVTLKDLSTKFQKFLYKAKVILRNKQIAWSLDGKFSGEMVTDNTFQNVKTFLKGLGDNNNIIAEGYSEISISIDGVLIQCSYMEYENENIFSSKSKYGKINLFIPEYHAPYVEAHVLLEQRILPILYQLKDNFKGCEESFTFDVYFKNIHPYLGMYFKGLDKEKLLSCNCTIKELPNIRGLTEESIVSISKSKLTLNTKNLYNLDQLMKKYLFLSGG